MEQKRSEAASTKRSFIILCMGLILIAGIVTISYRKQPDYSLFESNTELGADTSQKRTSSSEDVFPDAPLIAEPKNKTIRQKAEQVEPILPEIELEDPTEDITADVVHPKPAEEIFIIVDHDAKPREGLPAFKDFIQENLKYPIQASRLKVEGNVQVAFVVEKNGVVREVRSINSIGSGCDEEAVRLVSSSRPWSPAILNGQPVRQRRSVTVSFKLDRRTKKR